MYVRRTVVVFSARLYFVFWESFAFTSVTVEVDTWLHTWTEKGENKDNKDLIIKWYYSLEMFTLRRRKKHFFVPPALPLWKEVESMTNERDIKKSKFQQENRNCKGKSKVHLQPWA